MPRAPALLLLGLLPAALAPLHAQAAAADKIANAVSAAPASVSGSAAVMDWPAEPGAALTTLREGSNGWTCLPDFPPSEGNDPMCVDATWLAALGALMRGEDPAPTRAGIAYMIAPGGAWTSNTDPAATGPTPDNEWGFDPPHLMLIFPGEGVLDGLPRTREAGGPWVMWGDTPYAHVMVPLGPGGH